MATMGTVNLSFRLKLDPVGTCTTETQTQTDNRIALLLLLLKKTISTLRILSLNV
jgi:hypothetical protein